MTTEAHLEILNQHHSRLIAMGDFMSCADPREHIRTSNRLYDAAVDCGMDRDEADHEAWATQRITEWLQSGPLNECDQCGQACCEGESICPQCDLDNDASDFDRCLGIYA